MGVMAKREAERVPERYVAGRPCAVPGCPREARPQEYARPPGAAYGWLVDFRCAAGHRDVRRVGELWEALHEDPRVAHREHYARMFEEIATRVSGDVRTLSLALARQVRGLRPEFAQDVDPVLLVMRETGWPRARVEAAMREVEDDAPAA